MQVRIIAVGKIKEKFLSEGIAEYEKRLGPYLNVSFCEITEEKKRGAIKEGQVSAQKEREGERILAAIPDQAYVVVLDVRGKELSSESFAARIRNLQLAGTSQVIFVIGGDAGLSDKVLARAAFRLSLSPMTFTHQMVRLIFMEQLYRACRINNGEPYHK